MNLISATVPYFYGKLPGIFKGSIQLKEISLFFVLWQGPFPWGHVTLQWTWAGHESISVSKSFVHGSLGNTSIFPCNLFGSLSMLVKFRARVQLKERKAVKKRWGFLFQGGNDQMLMSNGKGPSDQDWPTIGRSTLFITLAFLECYIYHYISSKESRNYKQPERGPLNE